MKTSVVLGAISASLVTAEMLSPPPNFPDCGNTCFGNMLAQAAQLGCGNGGTTADAVDGACLCKNIDFSYGIIDCANAACPDGVAPTVIQYGVDWCAGNGVAVGGLSATPDASVASSASTTISATGSSGSSGSSSGAASSSATEGSSSTATASSGSTETSGTSGAGGVVIPISTTEIIATSTNSDGAVVTTTLSTSTIFSTSGAASGSGTESGSATDSGSVTGSTTFVTESTITAGGSTQVTSVTTTAPVTSNTEEPTSTSSSHGGAFQTAAPVGLMAAAGLAALML